MKIFLEFIQILSGLVTIGSGYGTWIDRNVIDKLGFETNLLSIIFYISLLLTIISHILYRRVVNQKSGRDKKLQFQIFGRRNSQNMK